MRFSVATAICAAPLALAGTLHAGLVARGAVSAEIISQSETSIVSSSKSNSNSKSNSDSKSNNNNNNNNNGNGGIFVQSSSTEIILVWVNGGGGAATSTVTQTKTVTENAGTAATASVANGAAAAAATHTVIVGGTAGLVYTPASINAAVGDMVVFQFESQNHTVTQSAFNTPCEALAGGMDTGFMANPNNTISPAPAMGMQVTVATPLWFYCRQNGHCGKGMTFSINPTANKTQAMFQSMAIAQNGTGSTAAIAGGTAASSAASVAAAPAATISTATTAAAAVSTGTGMVSGTGTINANGACSCSCLCGVAAFPNAAVQGVGAFGGMSGSMPMSALES